MSWIRHDSATSLDLKWRRISRKTGQSVPNILAVFWFMMESAQKTHPRGQVDFCFDDIEDLFEIEHEDTRKILDAFEAAGIIEGDEVRNWHKYQEPSTSRTRSHRDKKSNEINEKSPGNGRERSGTDETNGTSGTFGNIGNEKNATYLRTAPTTLSSLRSDNGADAPSESLENADFQNEPEPPPTIDFDKQLFDEAVGILAGKPMPDSGKPCSQAQARSLAGKLKKSIGGSPWQALQAVTAAKTAADPVQYVLGAINQSAKQTATGPPAMKQIRDILATEQAKADAKERKRANQRSHGKTGRSLA